MTLFGKSTLTFFALFITGSIIVDLVLHRSLDVGGIVSIAIVGAIAAALFGIFVSSEARSRGD